MTFNADASLLINAVVVILGVLIKMELHDIKARIMRLENVFIITNGKE